MITLLTNLYLSFFKIGLFGFGGGYAMISLIQKELANNGWLKLEEFVDIIAIAQMTPGPIAVNSGTFVGFEISAVMGSLIATIGVITPSFILVTILAHYFQKIKDSDYIENILKFLRPTVVALIIGAGFTIARTSNLDPLSFIVTAIVIITMTKTNIHPILIIILSGLSGTIIYM